jgi:hypothetical protein
MGGRPLDAREGRRQAAQQVEQAKKVGKERERWTLARCARDYHERVIETSRTTKHAAQWIASLEHHVPDALWHKSIAEIDAPELLAALTQVRSLEDKERRIPETLRCVRQRLDAVFEEGLFHKRCTSGAARRDQPDASPRAALRAGGTRAQPHRTHEAGGRQVIAQGIPKPRRSHPARRCGSLGRDALPLRRRQRRTHVGGLALGHGGVSPRARSAKLYARHK